MEFLTKNTVSATSWCKTCFAATTHTVLGGRKGACTVCEAKAQAEKAARDAEPPVPEQQSLFGK